ncbi:MULTISPECIES: NifU family protein [Apibacter]|uniref:NifU family protein n=1 Tax=Apibacter TaxID=1778601 RepID=UPI000CF8D065|nr:MULTISPECIES: NifU family protein [Apibacter]MCX8676440.1 NifU family protein [Apibacter sp. B3919]MXO23904.1 NifU family protein [Apibacter sp. B3924]MXO26419.1 NifU family protein [Apibacter sp. B3813]MXO28371.1 NifU family protein [Apibacter sp. B3913]MXO30325.1 NifU family protein [Apibacter sp. B3912]
MQMNTLTDRINQALEEIRPFLMSDGGDVKLIEIKDNKVFVSFTGACSDCSINQSTLKLGIESTIKKHVPEIEEVISISE